MIVRTEFLEEHPDLVKAVLVGLIDAIDAIEADPAAAQATVIDQIEQITAQRPSEEVIADQLREPDVHGRSDRGLAPEVRRRRDQRSDCSTRST